MPINLSIKNTADVLVGRSKPASPEEDPLSELFARVHERIKASGLTAEEVDAELTGYNAEDRF